LAAVDLFEDFVGGEVVGVDTAEGVGGAGGERVGAEEGDFIFDADES
jgi:hypothetical protein